jgi:hypothetical protein
MHFASLRATAVALLAGGLLMPAATFAAPAAQTGTVVGTVTCGPLEDAPAAHITVTAEGVSVQTQTDGSGKFILADLPALQTFTIDALADPQASFVTSRFNVVVQPGETLDIGSMDLAICGQPAQPAPAQGEQQTENNLND